MNSKTLDQYYQSHQEIYKSIAETCASSEELILTIALHGKTWTQWDWAFLIQHIGFEILFSNFTITQKIPNSKILLDDIIKTIQDNDLLDKIFTNKQVLNSLIQLVNHEYNNSASAFGFAINVKILNVLAQLFKKFPELWNMNYMFKKFKGKRYHRLCTENVTKTYNLTKDEIRKMDYKQHLNKFIEIYSV